MKGLKIVAEDKDHTRKVTLSGRLDKSNSSTYESELLALTEGVHELTLDLSELHFISSAGLRILLKIHLDMMTKGGLFVCNVQKMVKDIFEVTGFDNTLNIIEA